VFTALIVIGVLSGCVGEGDSADTTVRSLFRIQETLTDSQTRWIIVGETLLVFFLILLIILLVALFRRYRKTEKRALEASIRERTLMKENEMLDRLSRMKSEFFQNMSHDFKTPLTIISTSVLNALDELDYDMDKTEMRKSLKLAQSEVMRMSRVVDEALKHTAMHAGKQSTEAIDLELLLNMVNRTYHTFLERRGNTLKISIPKDLPYIYYNSDVLLNILSNLISNSNRYTSNGEIAISTCLAESSNGFVSIKVSDNGVGVRPEVLEKIFKRGASESGSGLGLHICKTAIESSGGTISVESEVGKGTQVSFTVPIYER